jgi:hypothetical protein
VSDRPRNVIAARNVVYKKTNISYVVLLNVFFCALLKFLVLSAVKEHRPNRANGTALGEAGEGVNFIVQLMPSDKLRTLIFLCKYLDLLFLCST